MQFSAGLAILAATSRDDPRQDTTTSLRSLVEDWTNLRDANTNVRNQRQRRRQARLKAATRRKSFVLTNKRAGGTDRMITKIANKVREFRETQKGVECDPRIEKQNHFDDERRSRGHTDNNDAQPFTITDKELGILAASSVCSVGETCRETSSSSLGGLCVDTEEWSHRYLEQDNPTDPETGIPTGDETTQFPTNDYGFKPDSIPSYIQDSCNIGAKIGYACVCDFATDDSYTGSGDCVGFYQCETTDSLCGVAIEDCYQTTYSVTLSGQKGFWEYEYCIYFYKPYEYSVCYSISTESNGESFLPDCQISLNGEVCSSCSLSPNNGADLCFAYDCSNTALAGNGRRTWVGNACDFPTHGRSLFLDSYGCLPCDLCESFSTNIAEGMAMFLTRPENTLTLYNSTYACSYFQGVSLQDLSADASCTYFASVTKECGCYLFNPPRGQQGIPDYRPTALSTTVPIKDSDNACRICPEGISILEGVISVPSWNGGTSEITCGEIELVGMGSIVGEELCAAVQMRASGPCCGIVNEEPSNDEPSNSNDNADYCTICGPDKIPTNLDNEVNVPTMGGVFSCGTLLELGKNGTLDDDDFCLLVQTAAQTQCGCVEDGPTAAPTASPTSSGFSASVLGEHGWLACATMLAVGLTLSLA